MRKGIFLFSILICLLVAPTVMMLQPSSSTAYGALQGLSTSTKDTYGPITVPFHRSTAPIQVPIQSGWEINSINMSFTNIRAPNTTITQEDDPFKPYQLDIWRAMSFQVPENQKAYLWNISFYVLQIDIVPLVDTRISVSLYASAYDDINERPEPSFLLDSKMLNISGGISVGWQYLRLDSPWEIDPAINPDPRVNNTFFIVAKIGNIVGHDVYWFFAPDEGAGITEVGREYEDLGYAYNSTDAGSPVNWNLEKHGDVSVDYCLRLGVSVSNVSDHEEPFPTDINMEVNSVPVADGVLIGEGTCNLTENFNISGNFAYLNVNSSWIHPDGIEFGAVIFIEYINVYLIMLSRSLTMFTSYTFMKDNQDQFFRLLGLIALGAVIASGYGGKTAYKRRKTPLNAMRSMENILIDHNTAGTLIWSFDFISMQQDVVLVSGFISAIKSFLEEMKVGGLKRLGTEFGTFIREESQLLTATCITGDIGLDEELWIRSKLHEFLIRIEQEHWNQLEDWKGDVGQFKESFPAILATLISLEKVQKLQRQKIEKLTKSKNKLQKKVNKYGAKLEELKSKYDSGVIDFKKYIFERYKTEAKYDKVQKDYLYASLFLSRAPSIVEAKPKPKDFEKMDKIQERFLEIRSEIEDLRKKELDGTITSNDLARKEKLQRELMTLVEKLDKLHKS
ncbi:MAG: hypothetical protein ACETWM_08875 [Candidatus Lokiarchaeia archaeon]